MIGRMIGHYTITEKIGEGGMGEVYRATDTRLKRDVALKILPESFAADSQRMGRFQREAEVLASLNHPNIGAIHGLEEEGGVRALVLELVPGETLAERIAGGPIPTEEALQISIQIARALESAHGRGIIHRDLKPANVKITPEGQVKVLDFGLAKACEKEQPLADHSQSPTVVDEMTQTGVILGTAAYMSPEQARAEAVDRRADIFAFGVVLYEMLTGKRAFGGGNVSDTIAAILKLEVDWTALPTDVPPVMANFLRLCLEKDPKRRIRDIGDLGLALEGAFEVPAPEAIAARAVQSGTPRRVVPLLATAILAATLGGMAVWRVMPDSELSTHVTRFTRAAPADVVPGGTGVGRHVVVLSPQGTHLVYWGNDRLHLHAMDQLGKGIPIQGTEGAREPFFSPDGQQTGFWVSAPDAGFQGSGQLKRVSLNGGAPITLGNASNPYGANWGQDGMIRYGQGANGIWQVPAAGGTPEQLIRIEDGELAHGPQLLPGGEWLLFTLRPQGVGSWDEAQIVVQSLKTGERLVLIKGGRDGKYLATGHLLYGVSGSLLAVPFNVGERQIRGEVVSLVEGVMDADFRTGAVHFSVSADGALVYLAGDSSESRPLVWVDREGRQEPLPIDPLLYASNPRISPDGAQIVLDIGRPGKSEVYAYEIARGTLTRLSFDSAGGRKAMWTPDSRRVVFYSDRDGGGLFSKKVDGTGGIDRLTTSAILQIPYSWTEDGRTLIFEQNPTDSPYEGELRSLFIDGEPGPTSLFQTAVGEREPVISPKGRWMAYTSDEPTGRDVYVRPFPNVEDGRWRISTDGGFSPLWAPDGKQLFFISSQGQAMAVPVETEPTFRPGTPRVMFDLPDYYRSTGAWIGGREWDITPDGERFLVVAPNAGAPDSGSTQQRIVVVLDWFQELKAKVHVP